MLPLRTFCRLWQIFKFNVKHSKEHEMKSFLVSWPISTLIRTFYQRHADTEESDIKYQTGCRHSKIFISLAPYHLPRPRACPGYQLHFTFCCWCYECWVTQPCGSDARDRCSLKQAINCILVKSQWIKTYEREK